MSRLPVYGLKLMLVLACLVGAALSVERSRLIFLSISNPQAAAAAAPDFAPAALYYGEILLLRNPKGQAEKRVGLAKAVLRDEPLNAAALRQIGLARDGGRVAPESRPFMILAHRMSRRDGLAQLWLAQDRAKSGDVLSAMTHVDTVMRVNDQAQDQIFPLLAQFVEGPAVASALAARSDAGAGWIEGYLNYLLAKNGDRRTIAKMIMSMKKPTRLRDAQGIARETIRELAIADEGELARDLFKYAVANDLLTDGGSGAAIPWRVFDQPSAAAETRDADGRLVLDILADSTARATVAQQVRFDASGLTRWVPRLLDARMPAGSQILLNVRCASSDTAAVIWSAEGDPAGGAPVTNSYSAVLPRPCPAAVYSIEVTGPREGEPLTASLTNIDARDGRRER